MKIRPVGSSCSLRPEGQADKQRDMTKLKQLFAILRTRLKIVNRIASNRNELNSKYSPGILYQ